MYTRRFAVYSIQKRRLGTQAKLVKPSVNIDHTQLFINNRFVDSVKCNSKNIDIIDPRNEQTIASVVEGSDEDVNVAIDAAYNALYKGPWYNDYTPTQRGKLLNKWANLIEENINDLCIIESWDVGMPLFAAKQAINSGINILRYWASWCDKIEGNTISPNSSDVIACTYREPIGVIGNILPWNNPTRLFLLHSAISLACGNTIVHKPAETSPLGALFCASLIEDAGIPSGVLNIINGFGETAGQALCKNNKIGKISFTGETSTGKEIIKTCSHNLIPISLELGGKSPCIIFPDANIDVAVDITQKGTFSNSGQVCCASTRIFVHESIYDEFIEKTINATKKRIIGDNLSDKYVDQGPQQNKQQFDKILKYIQIGKNEGADLLYGGNRLYNEGYYINNTIFGNVSDEMSIAKNEIFGPCMQILKFNDNVSNMEIDNILERANDTSYGLAAGIITNNTNIINKCRQKLQAGIIWVNCWNIQSPQTPFGGCKQSGFGRIGSVHAIDDFTKIKCCTQQLYTKSM